MTTPRARDGALGALLQAQEDLLAASAIAAGLGSARSRAAPARLAREARRFVRLLAAFLTPRSGAALGGAVGEELRTGAFAVSSAEERRNVLGVWRRVLMPILAGTGHVEDAQRVERALARIEASLARAATGWEPRRVDVVVVGASAGGLGAIADVLAALDAALPATLLVLLHVSERSPGLIPTLLSRHTGLYVAWAVDGAALLLGHAFVAPPGGHLVTRADGLGIEQGPPIHYVRPSADVLFTSAAEAFGGHVASVMLSGTGIDGSGGTHAVRARGGLTFAQDPATAEFRGMPDAAIATGDVLHVLRADRIGDALRAAITRGRDEPVA